MIEVIVEDTKWQALDLRRIADIAAAATLPDGDWDVAILACNDARISVLNTEFRGKPAPTNVLSWPSEERGAEAPGVKPDPAAGPELGDIAISFETCEREAAEHGKPMDDHVTHLIVHGLLHLLGYDHESDADATLMEGIETKILGKLGIEDPYSVND